MMKEQNGFTLLEVIIALFIFSVGLLAVASMQMTAIKGNYFSGTLTEASNWAADQMETLMSLPYADVDLAAGDHTSPQDIWSLSSGSDIFHRQGMLEKYHASFHP